MKKQIISFILIAITFLMYAVSSIAAPPFRLINARFVLKEDMAYVSENGDSLVRVRTYRTKVVRYDSLYQNGKFIGLTQVEKEANVLVRFSASLNELGFCGKTIEQIQRHHLGSSLVSSGVKNKLSNEPENRINALLLKNNVMVSFLVDDLVYTRYISGRAYRVIFQRISND